MKIESNGEEKITVTLSHIDMVDLAMTLEDEFLQEVSDETLKSFETVSDIVLNLNVSEISTSPVSSSYADDVTLFAPIVTVTVCFGKIPDNFV